MSAGGDPAAGPPGDRDPARALPAHFREKSPLTDTAGTPWSGRGHAPSPFPGDDGTTPAPVQAALEAHRRGEDPFRHSLVSALATHRVLVPIMAVATETGTTAHGLTGDNGADMAMVSLTGPDGQRVLPVFTSAAALSAWRREARPVPVVTPQAAQAAVQEDCTALLVNAATPAHEGGPVLLPRSVLWALAQGRDWVPPHEDPELATVLTALAAATEHVTSLSAQAGSSSEVDLHLGLVPGLDASQVRAVVQEVSSRIGAEQLVAERISSLRLVLRG